MVYLEALKVPSLAALDHIQVDIRAIDYQPAHATIEAIGSGTIGTDISSEHKTRQLMLGSAAKGLRVFWRVDAQQAHTMLRLVTNQQHNSVAIGDLNHYAFNKLCLSR